jgi:uncharacterized protein YbaP (TraB family)
MIRPTTTSPAAAPERPVLLRTLLRPLARWRGLLAAALTAGAALLLAPPALARAASAPQGSASAAAPRTDCPPVPREPSAEQLQTAMQGARDRGFLWRISKGGRDSYLYGTIHVGKLDWAFPGPMVREALEDAGTLALELDLTDPEVLAQLSRSMKPDPATRGARFQLPAPAQQRLARQAQLACVGPDVLSGQHPVMQAITLTVLAARHDGLDPSYAQELVLGSIARSIDKRIVSLESAEMQAGLLVPSDQKQALAIAEQTITQLEKGQARAMLVKVARVWDEGDLDQLASFERWCGCADTEAEREFLRRVNDERNGPMAERIDALHGGGQSVFAAVGALHMTGPRGLPQLLQQRGYAVERIRFAPR